MLGKVDEQWTVEHLLRSFHPEESFGFCRIWEKMIFSLKCKVRIDGRREKRNREPAPSGSEDAVGEKLSGRGVTRTTTITSLDGRHKGPVVA